MSAWIQEVVEHVPGEKIHCRGTIPADLEVFQDHFPGFAVLPGVLALEILKEQIERCVGPEPGVRLKMRLARMQTVKFQHFLRPGESWESRVSRIAGDAGGWTAQLNAQERPAVSARLWVELDN